MATAATEHYRVTAADFLAIIWDDSDMKAELDNGVIRMMGGGTAAHSRVQGNIFAALLTKLRGSGCSPHGSDMAVNTNRHSVRYPDVSVYCGRDGAENDSLQAFDDPKLIVEILSPSTRRKDVEVKLPEYRALPSLAHIMYIDPEAETIRLLTRTSASAWNDAELKKGVDVVFTALGVALTWGEIFGRR